MAKRQEPSDRKLAPQETSSSQQSAYAGYYNRYGSYGSPGRHAHEDVGEMDMNNVAPVGQSPEEFTGDGIRFPQTQNDAPSGNREERSTHNFVAQLRKPMFFLGGAALSYFLLRRIARS